LELVSPILNFQHRDVWQAQIRNVWEALTDKFDTCSTEQCSTHVHVSPSEAEWSLDLVKSAAKAVLYFEGCIDLVMPPDRRTNVWCKSNRWNFFTGSRSLPDLFGQIDAAKSIKRTVFIMSVLSPLPSKEFRGNSSPYDHISRSTRWNFTGLNKNGNGAETKCTIEFRQPPGSASAEDTQLWIDFAASFLQGAFQCAHQIDPTTLPTMELFRSFLLNGALLSGL
ncbi:hypothetical protein K491DRAFT_582771, partial [Lophiostoma macrostomum CBS 122681]